MILTKEHITKLALEGKAVNMPCLNRQAGYQSHKSVFPDKGFRQSRGNCCYALVMSLPFKTLYEIEKEERYNNQKELTHTETVTLYERFIVLLNQFFPYCQEMKDSYKATLSAYKLSGKIQ